MSDSITMTFSYPCDGPAPSDEGCDWHEMHHTDDDGNHWCPTGFMFCHTHGGVGTITSNGRAGGSCTAWGEPPEPPAEPRKEPT